MDALKRRGRGHRAAGSAPRAPHRVVPITASLVIHALLLAALAAVVWRTGSAPVIGGREIAIDVSSLAAAEAPQAEPPPLHAPDRSAGVQLHLEAPAPSPPAPLPESVEPLPSLASLPPADARDPRAEPGLAPDSEALPDFGAGVTAEAPSSASSLSAAPGPGVVVFAGLGAANARSVVYAVDASGSMVTSLRCVIEELERSVAGLAPTQKFGVVLFRRPPAGARGSAGIEVFAPVLVRATPSARQRLSQWLRQVEPSGRSVLLAGLERALAYRPDAVFVLSRAIERSGGAAWDAGGLAPTLARIEALNPLAAGRRPALIQTLQFLDDDPTGTMQEIGRLHGSRVAPDGRVLPGYRIVRGCEDLGADPAPSAARGAAGLVDGVGAGGDR